MRAESNAVTRLAAKLAALVVLLVASGCNKPEPRPELAASPLEGTYYEVARIPCDGGPEFVPPDPIREVVFWTDMLRVTWEPFESHVDYHGSYSLNGETIRIYDVDGSYVPEDIDKVGRFELTTEPRIDRRTKKRAYP